MDDISICLFYPLDYYQYITAFTPMHVLLAKKHTRVFLLSVSLRFISGKATNIPPAVCWLLHFSVSGITWCEDSESAYQSACSPALWWHRWLTELVINRTVFYTWTLETNQCQWYSKIFVLTKIISWWFSESYVTEKAPTAFLKSLCADSLAHLGVKKLKIVTTAFMVNRQKVIP